jgi:protein-S-isoprenylcysteine O-methyltransferase Ste14
MIMRSLLIRNLFFTILQPGMVAGLFPYWILGRRVHDVPFPLLLYRHYAGAIIFITGLTIMLSCIVNFAVKGKGTLSPADPTKHLVITGLYKYSRNPMYIGVMLILIGEAIFFQSGSLWIYALFIFSAFTLFVLLVEEPRLTNDFGEEYKSYCKRVRRWI